MKKKDRALFIYLKDVVLKYSLIYGGDHIIVRPGKSWWRGRYQGSCSKKGVIRIALRNEEGKRYEPYQFIDTMAHELAHVKGMKHDSEWFARHLDILSRMFLDGVYERLRTFLKDT